MGAGSGAVVWLAVVTSPGFIKLKVELRN